MASFIALDGVTSFLRLKDVKITCKRSLWREFFSAMAEKLEEAEDFVVYCVLESK